MKFVLNLIWKVRQKQPLILEMLVALCLAFLIWLYAHCRAQDTLDNVLIPVSLQMSPGQQDQYELDIQGPRQVTVSFAGLLVAHPGAAPSSAKRDRSRRSFPVPCPNTI